MLDKLINHVKSLGPFNIFLAIFILGLLYGGVTLYMKYLGFSKFMNRTQWNLRSASRPPGGNQVDGLPHDQSILELRRSYAQGKF